MTTVDRINQCRAQRAELAAEVDALETKIADLIRQALSEGIGPTELAKKINVSRARIYQIRDRRR